MFKNKKKNMNQEKLKIRMFSKPIKSKSMKILKKLSLKLWNIRLQENGTPTNNKKLSPPTPYTLKVSS